MRYVHFYFMNIPCQQLDTRCRRELLQWGNSSKARPCCWPWRPLCPFPFPLYASFCSNVQGTSELWVRQKWNARAQINVSTIVEQKWRQLHHWGGCHDLTLRLTTQRVTGMPKTQPCWLTQFGGELLTWWGAPIQHAKTDVIFERPQTTGRSLSTLIAGIRWNTMHAWQYRRRAQLFFFINYYMLHFFVLYKRAQFT